MYFRKIVRKNGYSQRQIGTAFCPGKGYEREPDIKT
jgi:hypothetical protein